jgi:hypothetical protein
MAQNFDVQIQALAGSATQTEMDDWATDGVKEIINILPYELKIECATMTALTSSTPMDLDITGEVFHVTRENADAGYHTPCRKIPSMYGGLAEDSSNLMFYGTATDPVYWTESDTGGDPKLFVKPTPTANQPARVHHVAFPSVNVSDVSAIVNFPNEAEYLVVLYAAIKVLQNKMNEKSSSLPSDIPSVAIPNAPSDVDVSLSFIKPIFDGVAPTYNSVIVAPDFADANNWLNTEEDSDMVASRVQVIQAQLQEHKSNMQDELNQFNKENAEYQVKLQQYSGDITNESERVQKAIQTYQAETGYDLSKYQAEVQSVLAKYAQDIQNYNAKIQKHSVDYQWYQAQQAKLQQDYNQGIQLLIGRENLPKQSQQQGER